ncbi:MAG: energy-coupling factor transporter ATPase [Firmicutes bacterium]|nr:energy-coupling factor transporter ATPase [Bacillota bacterium]
MSYIKNDDIIQIEHLLFQYQREENKETVTAIDDVSFSVKRGSFTAVIGRNGSGKSTLAKNINALLLPSGGAVYVNGYDTKDEEHLWEIRQSAGMVFQNPDNQLVSSIVEDDVAFGPENLGVEPSEIRRRVDEALKKVNMYQHRKRAPHHLSGGQKQRVAIAGVMAMRPECVILDEPTAMLDPKGRAQVMDIIHQLHEEGITIVLITHFMDEAAQADRIIIMDDGHVVLDGVPKDVFLHGGKIRDLYLDVPFAVEMAEYLRDNGMEIPTDIIDTDTLVTYLSSDAAKISEVSEKSAFKVEQSDTDTAPEKEKTGTIVAEVKNLRHVFNAGLPFESIALNDVSFALEENSFTALIGHTGSGKSTLIQHLNGLLKPTGGSVYINGEDIHGGKEKLRDVRKNVGLVFQYPEYQLFEETVLKDVCYGPLNLGLSQEEAEQKAKRAIELVGLDFEEVKNRSPFALSGGQKRRVAIDGVIAMEPKMLILDEPTAGLDPKSHHDILLMIEKIKKEGGVTILLVSHNMGDAARLADRVLVMDGGRLWMNGTPQEVFSKAEELSEIGLGLPPATEFMYRLKQSGVPVETTALTVQEALADVLRWKRGEL